MKLGAIKHPKIAALMRELKINRREAVGLLEMLWHFAGEYCHAGDIGRFTDEEIAAAIEIDAKESTKLVAALIKTRWIDRKQKKDGRLAIHDWLDHAPEYVKNAWKEAGFRYHDPANLSDNVRQRRTMAAYPTPPHPTPPNPTPPHQVKTPPNPAPRRHRRRPRWDQTGTEKMVLARWVGMGPEGRGRCSGRWRPPRRGWGRPAAAMAMLTWRRSTANRKSTNS